MFHTCGDTTLNHHQPTLSTLATQQSTVFVGNLWWYTGVFGAVGEQLQRAPSDLITL